MKMTTSLKWALIILVFFSLITLLLEYKTFNVDSASNMHTILDGYGDIPLHMTQVSKFAYTPFGNVSDPIFYGNKLQYPFFINFLSGMILRAGCSWTCAMFIPAAFFALANIFLLFCIYQKITKRYSVALIAVLLFFLGSGLSIFYESNAIQKISDGQFISINTNYFETGAHQVVDFTVPLTSSFLFQRAFLPGFFVFLCFIYLLLLYKETREPKYIYMAGAFFGSMPLVHTHTFIASAIVFAVYLFIDSWQQKSISKINLGAFVGGCIIALPALFYLINLNGIGGGFIHFRLGWMSEQGIRSITFLGTSNWSHLASVFSFYFLNFGVLLPLFLIALLRMAYAVTHKKPIPFVYIFACTAAFAIFVAVQLIRFQPWDFDNNKLLLYFQFFEVIVLIWLYDFVKRYVPRVAVTLAVIVLCVSGASGVADVLSHINMKGDKLPVIFSAQARDMAQYIDLHVPPDELIITGETHLNIVSSLLGRSVYVSYPGWLWTRNIAYGTREEELKDFYAHPSLSAKILSTFPATYALIDPQTQIDFAVNTSLWQKTFPLIYSNGLYSLYKIQ